MENQEMERARQQLKRLGADWALLSSAENVTYVSHFETPVEFGIVASLSYGPHLALIGVEEPTSCLLTIHYLEASARNRAAVDEVFGYGILQVFEPYARQDIQANYLAKLRQILKQAGLDHRKVRLAVEAKTLPLAVSKLLQSEYSNLEIIEAFPAVELARKTKTEREEGLLRHVAEVVNIGHKELRLQTRQAGKSEFELWSAVTQKMFEYVGERFLITGELVCGPRNKTVSPGGPIHYRTQPGDLVEFDVSPRINGYWADMANMLVIESEPTEVQKKYARAARDSFYAGADMLRPGNKANQVFGAARAAYDKYGLKLGHYIGHGIGTAVSEMPWFVPSDETVLEAGMVVCIETGAYAEEASGKCEKSLIIRESGGPDIFPDFEWGIPL